MTEDQYRALLEYIDKRIDEKINDAFGRDSLVETIRCNDAERELRIALVETD